LIDHVRKQKRIQLKDSFDETTGITLPAPQFQKAIEMAFDRLNEIQKSLVLLKDYEGYSYEEIGEITGLNSSQVKVYLHRARIKLKEFIVRPENVI
jgi:RNA polymerase sigma-70 factor (ECF subfamily)